MYTNVNLAAPVGAIFLLGTALLLFVIALGLIVSLLKKKSALTTLLIREAESLTRFVIGHENTPFHKKTWFQI